MMTPDEFARAMRAQGGRVDTSTLDPKLGRIFEREAGRARTYVKSASDAVPRLPPIYFDFIDNGSINAVAFRTEAGYAIGVNAGVVLRFFAIFGRAMADPQTLPWIGQSHIECRDLPPIADLFTENLSEYGVVDGRAAVARDPFRRLYGFHCAQTAFDFLVSHEVTHIANGHVDLEHEVNNVAALIEFNSTQSVSAERLLARQTLEMDADCGAASDGAGTLLRKVMQPPIFGQPWSEFYQESERAFFALMFSYHSLFRIFGDAQFTAHELVSSWYPPFRLRQYLVSATVLTYLHNKCATNLLDAWQNSNERNVIAESEKMFAALTGTKASVAGMEDALSPDGREHLNRLETNWATIIRPKLLPLAYAKLPG
jgi:hypothetical protein